MRLITNFELATKSRNELLAMLRECYIAFAMSSKDMYCHTGYMKLNF